MVFCFRDLLTFKSTWSNIHPLGECFLSSFFSTGTKFGDDSFWVLKTTGYFVRDMGQSNLWDILLQFETNAVQVGLRIMQSNFYLQHYFASAGNDLFMFVIYSKRSFGFMYPTFLLYLLAHKKFTSLKVNLSSFKLNSVKLNAVMGTSRVFSQLEQNNHLTLIQSPERKLATTMRWNPFWNIYHTVIIRMFKKFMKSLVKMSVYH